MSLPQPIHKDAYKCLLGTCGWHTFLFQEEAIASLLIPSFLPQAKYAGKVCRGKQGQLKVFAYVPLLCAWVNLLSRWDSVVLRVRTLKPSHKLHITGQTNFSVTDNQVSLLLVKKWASYARWIAVSLPGFCSEIVEISTAIQVLEKWGKMMDIMLQTFSFLYENK